MREKILLIDACVGNRETSRTLRLADELIQQVTNCLDNAELLTLRLTPNALKPLSYKEVQLRDERIDKMDFNDTSFNAAKQLAEADYVIIAAPYWDLSFPSVLKVYIENIMVRNLTFRYTDLPVPEGLCRAKKFWYVTTAGGYIGNMNFGFDYIKATFNFLGIRSSEFLSAEGLDIAQNNSEEILLNEIKKIREIKI